MQELSKQEMLQIEGGISISCTLINSLVRGINALLDLGRSLGSAIRRAQGNHICPV